MVPETNRATLAAVLLGSLVALSGIGTGAAALAGQPAAVEPSTAHGQSLPADAANDSSRPAGEEVVESVRERVASLDTLVMTYESSVTVDGEQSMTTERRLWADYENDRVRTETETDRVDVITVHNESGTVTYDVENEQVNRIEGDDWSGPETPVDRFLDESDLTYETRERLDGELTYRLEMTPADGESTAWLDRATVWVDADTFFPTKFVVDSEVDGSTYESTTRIRNVSLNEPIPDERFTIDIPADAEESSYSVPERTSYDSLAALQDGTDRTAPSPDVPDAYRFVEGYTVESEDYAAMGLRYATEGGETLHVSKRPAADYDYDETDMYEELDVGDRTGYYTEYEFDGETMSTLVLDCTDSTYTVFGGLSQSESVDVAESLGCA
jgi:outer membrane lipoprotein-sorting protein